MSRPTIVSTAQLTDTTQKALVVGAAVDTSTGTGGANLGSVTLNAAVAPVTTAGTLYNTAGVPIFGVVPLVQGSGTSGQIPKFTTGASGIVGDSVYSEANLTTIKGGGIVIASQAAGDVIYATSATQLGRVAIGTALQFLRVNAAANGYEFVANELGLTHLGGGSGTNSSGSATNVSTVAISNLTALDQLLVLVRDGGGSVGRPSLYNSTDSVTIQLLGYSIDISSEQTYNAFFLSKDQSSTTSVMSIGIGGLTGAGGGSAVSMTPCGFATAWTAPWTLALRHGGVSSGMYRYNWTVLKVAGQ